MLILCYTNVLTYTFYSLQFAVFMSFIFILELAGTLTAYILKAKVSLIKFIEQYCGNVFRFLLAIEYFVLRLNEK